ncbi:MAG: hypothetical protein RMJ56_06695 [Gemmataceae bacterium]|nr:hypothetical protein [Gemmata sp.]MDW8197278.1 hypothetical protein [Gemmataceae bacterium]
MTFRRLWVGLALVSLLSAWGVARSRGSATAIVEPIPAEQADGLGNHDEAEARYRHSQSLHWRHVAVGHWCSNR